MGNFTSKLFYNDSTNEMKVKAFSKPLVYQKTMQNHQDIFFTSDDTLQLPTENCKAEKPFLEMDLDVKVAPLISEHWSDPRSPSSAYPRTPILIQNIGDTFSTLKINAGNQAESDICDKIKSIKNDIDPRSPAVDFDRTPILKIRTLEHSKSSELQRNSRRLKNISNLDISIRSSYCEDANSCHIPEIHALQDVILSWNKSYDVDLSSITDNLKEHKSNNISHDNKLFPEKLFSEDSNDTFKIKEYLEIDKKDCNNFPDSTGCINSFIASEEKFLIWKDSSELLSIPPVYVSNQLKNNLTSKIENEEISMQSRDSSNLNYIKNNYRTDLDKISISAQTYEKIKENVKITKENSCSKIDVKVSHKKKSMNAVNQNLIDLSKNRTPLSNRSNSIDTFRQ